MLDVGFKTSAMDARLEKSSYEESRGVVLTCKSKS